MSNTRKLRSATPDQDSLTINQMAYEKAAMAVHSLLRQHSPQMARISPVFAEVKDWDELPENDRFQTRIIAHTAITAFLRAGGTIGL